MHLSREAVRFKWRITRCGPVIADVRWIVRNLKAEEIPLVSALFREAGVEFSEDQLVEDIKD